MKKAKKVVCLLSAAVFVLSAASCTATGGKGDYTEPDGHFELSAFTANSDSGAYDNSLFYRNDFSLLSADVACIYVPEGRHADENGVDEIGGYYYLYPSAAAANGQGMVMQSYGDYKVTNPVLRSTDLTDWELCGALENGYSTRFKGTGKANERKDGNDWVWSGVMAPEVIYDENTGKYFLYSQAASYINDGTNPNVEYSSSTDASGHDRFYISISIADSPMGPFETVTSENYYGDAEQPNLNGKVITNENPPINFQKDLGLDEAFSVIDIHPFIDYDGQLYLYFCKHISSTYAQVNIWGMKMKDFITPDYSSMTMLIRAGYTSVTKNAAWESAPWLDSSYDMGEAYVLEEGAHGTGNEGAFMVAKNYKNAQGEEVRRYFLSYAGGGYQNKYYDFSQTISDNNPLGPFVKPKQYASSVVGTSKHNDWNNSSGHGCIVPSPDGSELWYLGGAQGNAEKMDAGMYGRWLTVEKVGFVQTDEYGLLMYGNGPTKSLQPKMSTSTGVKNIASKATVKAYSQGGCSGIKYLTDGIFVSTEYYKDWEFETEGETVIVLEFDMPRTVRSIMVYNSYSYEYAFSQIDYIEFSLAEKPSWYDLEVYKPTARVSNLVFNEEFVGTSYEYVRSGASCLAAFNPIKVNSITVRLSKKITDENAKIRIADIVVLGN